MENYWWKWSFNTFLEAVATVDVFVASNNDIKFAVFLFWEYKKTLPQLLVMPNFYQLLVPWDLGQTSNFSWNERYSEYILS